LTKYTFEPRMLNKLSDDNTRGKLMHPEDIKSELRKGGWTLRSIALECGVSPGLVSNVVKRKMRSKRIETNIAKKLRKKRAALFPSSRGIK